MLVGCVVGRLRERVGGDGGSAILTVLVGDGRLRRVRVEGEGRLRRLASLRPGSRVRCDGEWAARGGWLVAAAVVPLPD